MPDHVAACYHCQATFLSKDAKPFFEPWMLKITPIPRIPVINFKFYTISLELSGLSLGELEVDVAAREAAIDLGVGVQAVVNTTTLLLIEDDLEGLAAVLLSADALTDDLNGVGEVGKDSVVDSSESAGTRTLLLLGVAAAGRALGAGQDAARGEDQDMAVGELLLELTGETTSMLEARIANVSRRRMLTAAAHGGNRTGKGRGQR